MVENDEKIELKPKNINFSVNGMPEKIFLDWNKSCIENYGDSRWVKMFSDHQKAKQFDEILNLYSKTIDDVDELKNMVESLYNEFQKFKLNSNNSSVTLNGND